MLNPEILGKLVYYTDEEIDYLNGKRSVDKSIFLNEKSSIIDASKLLLDNQLLTIRKHARFIDYPKHKHNYIELMYVYSGEMTHIIDDESFTIHAGEILLLNQKIEHSIKFCGENDIIFNFIIKPEFFEFLSTLIDNDNVVFNFIFEVLYSIENSGEYLVFKSSNRNTISAYVESIITELYLPNINSELQLKLLVGLLLTELMKYPEDILSHKLQKNEELLNSSILKYIFSESQSGSLSEISNRLGIPDYKVCRIVKKYTGKTFIKLVQQERLKKAAHLLLTTRLSVEEIMVEVGYENITYFYKLFKEKYNKTPYTYRKRQ